MNAPVVRKKAAFNPPAHDSNAPAVHRGPYCGCGSFEACEACHAEALLKEAQRGTRSFNEMFHAMMDDLAAVPLAGSGTPAPHGPLCWCPACSATGYGHFGGAVTGYQVSDGTYHEDGRSLRRVCAAFDSTEAP